MCAIVGYLTRGNASRKDFLDALSYLSDRGPNDQGYFTDDDVAIGHRRLSVIDVAGNKQPHDSICKRFVITFNGEIYNYLELNKILVEHGVLLSSVNDTAVLVELFVLMGEKALALLNGMFSFVIYDRVEKRLFGARDRFGEKPFFYFVNDTGLHFASTVAGLKKFSRLDLSINKVAALEFLLHQYISDDSIYSAVKRLAPGHFFYYSLTSGLSISSYWQLSLQDSSTSYRLAQEEIRSLIDDSIRIRLRSDVPLGIFLSGGLDSSILTSVASNYTKSLDSFCLGFDQASYDESNLAGRASKYYSTKHNEVKIDYSDGIINRIVEIVKFIGEPFADPAMIPMWDLCREASQKVTVALSGDGADELFAGYRRYLPTRYAPKFLEASPFSKAINKISSLLGTDDEYFSKSRRKQIGLLGQYLKNSAYFKSDYRPKLFSIDRFSDLIKHNSLYFDAVERRRAENTVASGLKSQQLCDISDYLPNNILLKTDRMSMHFGLEVRTPFLDHRLVEYAVNLPDCFKISAGSQKRILRKIYCGEVLPEIMKAKKHGFSPPVNFWLKEELAEVLSAAIEDKKMDEYISRQNLAKLWNEHKSRKFDHSFGLWNVVVFYLWLNYG